jgi:hypothetical protein
MKAMIPDILRLFLTSTGLFARSGRLLKTTGMADHCLHYLHVSSFRRGVQNGISGSESAFVDPAATSSSAAICLSRVDSSART